MSATYTASETLSITGLDPVQCSATLTDNVGGARASSALVCPKTNPVDTTFVDGANPAANQSIRLAVGAPYTIYGYQNIKNAAFFNTDGNDASLYVQYSY
jgi:hypothetical protein